MTMPYEPLTPEPPPRRSKSLAFKAGLIGAGVAAGALAATAIGATAASGGSSSAPSASSTATGSAADSDGDHNEQGGDRGGHDGEKAPSATTAATLKAAALKAVPGGTVVRVESDSGDAAYEAHMKKSDGTEVTVKFDKNLKVTGVEDGMGK